MSTYFPSLQDAIHTIAGNQVEIRSMSPVSGGDINHSYCITLNSGDKLFMKANESADPSFFQAEDTGLNAIASTKTLHVPEVLARGHEQSDKEYEFLLMPYLESKKPSITYWQTLGQQLTQMHKADTSHFVKKGRYGFLENNFIGQNIQTNAAHDDWISFFRDCRLIPQARMAETYFDHTSRQQFLHLLDHLDEYLVEPEVPSLLHGDLWSGNVMPGTDGSAWLIDPAVYVGDAEADLAMTELFGGFPAEFYRAYEEVSPLQDGYHDRRDLYNLYHLLNHTNLFGWSYFSSVERILDYYIGG